MTSICKSLLIVVFFLAATHSHAQKTVKLWEGNPPTNNELTGAEKVERDGGWVGNVYEPEMQIYQADKANNNGMAVLICPGGGYGGLAIGHEGVEVAKWLNTLGITGVVLKYRMPNKRKEIPLDDAWQAMRYIRDHASELGVNPNKIGVAGFSAGGHLASTVSTHYAPNGTSTRPDFSILVYPVITMEVATHGGSRNALLGDKPSLSDIHRYSNEKQVSVNTPPTILLLSDDDKVVLPENSIRYYDALKKNDIPATMYIFPEGGHGWGMNTSFKYHSQMLALLQMWLKDIENKK